MEKQNQLVIYKTENGRTEIDVRLENETVWLSQAHLTELFERDQSVISRHINNIFKEGELEKEGNMHFLHIADSDKPVAFYNLDVIISVGYRVKSRRGTQFRIWANKILKDYLVKGYILHEKKLKETQQQFLDLKQTVKLLEKVVKQKPLSSDEATGLLKVITDYTYALDILDRYDHEKLSIEKTHKGEVFTIRYEDARRAIHKLKEAFGGSTLFGLEKDASFKSSLNTIYQTFEGCDLYPSVEEKAANLLYFIVKNHSFTDGNKRIAAFIFVWFLERNSLLYTVDGQKRIADNALVALTLMIAESRPEEKNTMVKVIVNLINKNN